MADLDFDQFVPAGQSSATAGLDFDQFVPTARPAPRPGPVPDAGVDATHPTADTGDDDEPGSGVSLMRPIYERATHGAKDAWGDKPLGLPMEDLAKLPSWQHPFVKAFNDAVAVPFDALGLRAPMAGIYGAIGAGAGAVEGATGNKMTADRVERDFRGMVDSEMTRAGEHMAAPGAMGANALREAKKAGIAADEAVAATRKADPTGALVADPAQTAAIEAAIKPAEPAPAEPAPAAPAPQTDVTPERQAITDEIRRLTGRAGANDASSSNQATKATSRTGEQPRPNEAADVGNDVNPPTRDQDPTTPKTTAVGAPAPGGTPKAAKIKTVSKKRSGAVEVQAVEPVGPDATLVAALQDKPPASGVGIMTSPKIVQDGLSPDDAFVVASGQRPFPDQTIGGVQHGTYGGAPARLTAAMNDDVRGVSNASTDIAAPRGEVPAQPVASTPTVPESGPTIDAQIEQLKAGDRDAVMIPKGTEIPEKPAGFKRTRAPDDSVWFYRSGKVRPAQIFEATRKGKQNELLGLGDKSKAEVEAETTPANPPTAVQEVTPEDTPVRDVATTEQDAPRIAAQLEENKSPGNTVRPSTPERVLADRVASRAAPETPEPRAPEPTKEGPRILRAQDDTVAAELDKKAKDADRGFRGRDDLAAEELTLHRDIPEDATDRRAITRKIHNEEKRFFRRAQLSVSELGENAPDYYRTALAAREKRQVRGDRGANKPFDALIDDARVKEQEAKASGVELPKVKGSVKATRVAKVEEKAKKAQEAVTAEAPEKPAPAVTDEEVAAARKADKQLADLPDEQVRQILEITKPKIVDKGIKGVFEFDEGKASSRMNAAAKSPEDEMLIREAYSRAEKSGAPEDVLERITDAENGDEAFSVLKTFMGESEGAPAAKAARNRAQPTSSGKRPTVDMGEIQRQLQERAAAREAEEARPAETGKSSISEEMKQRLAREAMERLTAKDRARREASGEHEAAPASMRIAEDAPREDFRTRTNFDQLDSESGPTERIPAKMAKVRAQAETERVTRLRTDRAREMNLGGEERALLTDGPDGSTVVRHVSTGESAATHLHTNVRTLIGEMKDLPGGTPLSGMLEGLLRRIVGDTPVYILSDADLRRITGRDHAPYGYFQMAGRGSHIVLNHELFRPENAAELRHTLAHEAVHAALVEKTYTNPAATAQLVRLMNFVKNHTELFRDDYAFKDVHEFLAEVLSREDLQATLRELPLPKELADALGVKEYRGKTMWRAVIEKFAEWLGFKGPHNALEGVLSVTDKMLRNDKSLPAEMEAYVAMHGLADPYNSQYGAPTHNLIKNPEARFFRELRARGVPIDKAREIAKAMIDEMGKDVHLKNAMPVIKHFAAKYGQPLQGRPGSARAAAIQQQQAQGRAPTSGGNQPPAGNPPAAGAAPGVGPRGRNVLQRAGKAVGETDIGEKLREHIIDYNRPVEKLAEIISDKLGRPLTDEENFYEQKRTLGARIAGRIRQLQTSELREGESIIRDASRMGIDIKELGSWLTARHAEERNLHHGNMDPASPEGSGMSVNDANAKLAAIAADPQKKALFDRVVKLNDRLRDIELDAYESSGLLSSAQVSGLRGMFSKYTSLKGFDDPALQAALGGGDPSLTGRLGSDVMGRDVKESKGRKTESDNPLQNMFQQAARALERAEKNKTMANAGETFRKAGNAKGDGVYVAENIGGTPAKSLREAMLDQRVLGFKEDGAQKYLVFDTKELAQSFERMAPEERLWVAKKAVELQNKIKNLWTHYSPVFVARHFLFRYPIEGIMNLKGAATKGLDARILPYIRDISTTVPDIARYLRGDVVKDPQTARLMKLMEDEGGIVSFRNIGGVDVKKLADDISLGKDKGALKSMHKFHEAWDRNLTAMDTAQRLAVFKRALDAGHSAQKAAIMARDATVDFARKGKSEGAMSLWLPFVNVAVQTTARMGREFANSASYRKMIAGVVGGAAAIEAMNYLVGGDDKDGTPWIEKVPSWERIQNLVIMLPGSSEMGKAHYVKVPLPYPLFGVWPAGSAITQSAMMALGVSKLKGGDIGSRIMHGMAETLTPFGRNVGNLAALATPELPRVVTELGQNKDWKGDNIHTQYPKRALPASEQGRTGTGEGWKTVARHLAKVGLDFYPEDIRHVVDHYFGAQRRFVRDTAGVVSGVSKGDVDASRAPGASLVYGRVDSGKADRGRMYNLQHAAELTPAELRAVRSDSPNATDRALINAAESRTGMTAKQLRAVNETLGDVKKFDKEVREAPEGSPKRDAAEKRRSDFLAQQMKKLNDLGIRGGLDKH